MIMFHSQENGMPQEEPIRPRLIETQIIINSPITCSAKMLMSGGIELLTIYTKFIADSIDQMMDGPEV